MPNATFSENFLPNRHQLCPIEQAVLPNRAVCPINYAQSWMQFCCSFEFCTIANPVPQVLMQKHFTSSWHCCLLKHKRLCKCFSVFLNKVACNESSICLPTNVWRKNRLFFHRGTRPQKKRSQTKTDTFCLHLLCVTWRTICVRSCAV